MSFYHHSQLDIITSKDIFQIDEDYDSMNNHEK